MIKEFFCPAGKSITALGMKIVSGYHRTKISFGNRGPVCRFFIDLSISKVNEQGSQPACRLFRTADRYRLFPPKRGKVYTCLSSFKDDRQAGFLNVRKEKASKITGWQKRPWLFRAIQRSPRGMMLLEMILAWSIFVMGAVAVFLIFTGGLRLDRRSEQNQQTYREVLWSFDQISRDLERMMPYDFSGSYPIKAAFEGSSDHIQFLIADGENMKMIRYAQSALEESHISKTIIRKATKKNVTIISGEIKEEQNKTLVRQEVSFLEFLENGFDKSEAEILFSRLTEDGLKFSFGFVEEEKPVLKLAWKDSWGKTYLPKGVRIELTLKSEHSVPGSERGVKTWTKKVLNPSGDWGRANQ